jgi:hypothetical protein
MRSYDHGGDGDWFLHRASQHACAVTLDATRLRVEGRIPWPVRCYKPLDTLKSALLLVMAHETEKFLLAAWS